MGDIYLPKDFDCLEFDYLKSFLEMSSCFSIRAKLEFYREFEVIVLPFLYIGTGSREKGVVDLLSIRGQRQKYGEDFLFEIPENSLYAWYPYQKVLRDLVFFYTNLSVEDKLRQDVYQLFLDWELQRFHGANIKELKDIQYLFSYLINCYYEEYQMAHDDAKKLMLERR